MALRFVLSNSNIDVALSGITTIEQLEENVKVAGNSDSLSTAEVSQIEAMVKENERLAGLFCTSCKYCLPCPQNINIPDIFNFMNYHRVYQITEYAKKEYDSIGKLPWRKYNNASLCNECGTCEEKCPQKIPIREQLKETHRTLA
jgi:predicted aldo/keto reductase-like oxidoreductase